MGDLAKRTGKTVRALHLYEELGLLEPALRSKGGFRLYRFDSVVRVRWITKLQDMGFSLGQIREILREWSESGLSSAPRAMHRIREIYESKLVETRDQIARLESLSGELEASLAYLDTCDTCDPGRLVEACPSCDVHDRHDKPPELVAGLTVEPAQHPQPPAHQP